MKPPTEQVRHETDCANESRRALARAANEGDPIERLRLVCLSKGATGLLALGRIFRHMDHDGSKHLDFKDFVDGLLRTGIEISEDEAQATFDKFDVHGRGVINVDDFLFAVRPPMSDCRISIIDKAFEKMDKNGEGIITIRDLKRLYNVKAHPTYMSGEDSSESILDTFLAHFEKKGAVDGILTKEEFLNYYGAISASIDNDCFFDLMMRQTYKL